MKIKCRPEDFVVEELSAVTPGEHGPFVYYRLTKVGLGTPEALDLIRRRWNLGMADVHYGGLKDRHARTIQYVTIRNGPDRILDVGGLSLEPLGRLTRPFGPESFRGNRFHLVLRDLRPDEVEPALEVAGRVGREGVPNYFDDQRFGSVGYSGEFIAHAWLRGQHEQALRLALAEPTPMDRPETRKEKAIVQECWGHWVEAKARLPRSNARSIVTYLVDHPEDFKGAFARLRRDLRTLWFSAFQSHLWNLLLGRILEERTRPDQRIEHEFKTARLPIHHDLDPETAAELARLQLPLPSSRNPIPPDPIGAAARAVLEPLELSWEELRVRGLKDVFFSKGSRPALLVPEELTAEATEDELYPGRRAINLRFSLPRGAYATMIVKRIQGEG